MPGSSRFTGLALIGTGILSALVYVIVFRIGAEWYLNNRAKPIYSETTARCNAPRPSVNVFGNTSATFGAIELGTGGINAAVYSLSTSRARELLSSEASNLGVQYDQLGASLKKPYEDTPVNVADPTYREEALRAVDDYVERMRKDKIDCKHVYVVVQEAVARKYADIEHAITDRVGIVPSRMSAEDECRLTFLWIVPKKDESSALVVDVGSGNVKACTSEKASEILAQGTKTLAFATENSLKNYPSRNFNDESARAGREIENTFRQFAQANPAFRNKGNVYLTGGAVWVTATLMHPEGHGYPRPLLSLTDFKKVREIAAAAKYGNKKRLEDCSDKSEEEKRDALCLIKPPGAMSDSAEAAVSDDVAQLNRTFTPNQMISGMDIIISVANAFEISNTKKEVMFSRGARDGWMSRFVVERVAGVPMQSPQQNTAENN